MAAASSRSTTPSGAAEGPDLAAGTKVKVVTIRGAVISVEKAA